MARGKGIKITTWLFMLGAVIGVAYNASFFTNFFDQVKGKVTGLISKEG